MITLNYILLTVCVFALLHKYYTFVPHAVVRVKYEEHPNKPNNTFKPLGPHRTQVTIIDTYSQLLNITNFNFTINPDPCKGYTEGLLLIVIVASNPVNNEKRTVIRNTWGKNFDTTKVVFLVGETKDAAVDEQIRNESDTYGDIVQGTFMEAYRNMTYKHVMGLKWVAHHCPTAKYVLKTDDDVFVNTHELRHYLAVELSPWGTSDLILCPLLVHTPVLRNYTKWAVTKDEFEADFYPTYCAGWAILYSQDVVPRLLHTAQSTPYFWIDDVQITGVVAEKVGIPRSAINSMILSGNNLQKLLSSETVPPFILGPVELTTDRIMAIWKSLSNFTE